MMRWLPWALVVAVAAAGRWLTLRLIDATRAESELRRAAEADLLEQQGLNVELQVRVDEAEKRATKAEASTPELRAAVQRARAAAPGARVVEVLEAKSAPLIAGGEPRPPSVGEAPMAPCLVAPGDRLELRSVGVTLQYREGNRVPVVAGEAWRIEPGPPTRIAAGELEISTAVIAESAAELTAPGWGFGGVVLGATGRGVAYGLAVSPPPARLLGWRFDLTAGVGLGRDGVQGTVIVLGRL